MAIFIGIDNGVSGSVGVIKKDFGEGESSVEGKIKFDVAYMFKTPVRRIQKYTKTKKFQNVLDGKRLLEILTDIVGHGEQDWQDVQIALERPMINPGRWLATESAVRCDEATRIVVEELMRGNPSVVFRYIDSKEWQKELLPGYKGEYLKKHSLELGQLLYPHLEFKGYKDADGILIAEYLKRTYKEE